MILYSTKTPFEVKTLNIKDIPKIQTFSLNFLKAIFFGYTPYVNNVAVMTD